MHSDNIYSDSFQTDKLTFIVLSYCLYLTWYVIQRN